MNTLQAILLTLAGVAGAGYIGNHQGHKSGMAHGRVQGCQEVFDVAIPEMYSPTCTEKNGRLVLTLIHPETGEIRSEYIDNGERVEE